jgi:hypothetical protein
MTHKAIRHVRECRRRNLIGAIKTPMAGHTGISRVQVRACKARCFPEIGSGVDGFADDGADTGKLYVQRMVELSDGNNSRRFNLLRVVMAGRTDRRIGQKIIFGSDASGGASVTHCASELLLKVELVGERGCRSKPCGKRQQPDYFP